MPKNSTCKSISNKYTHIEIKVETSSKYLYVKTSKRECNIFVKSIESTVSDFDDLLQAM